MEFDIASYLGAVTRVVERCQHDGRPASKVVASRSYPTDADDLWEAITTAERIPRWLTPISGDLRLGGRYQLEGNAGGEILRCEPPKLLAVTWEFGGSTSWVTVALAPKGSDRTLLTLEHLVPAEGDHWDRFGPGAVGVGWDLMLLGLFHHITTGGSIDPKDGLAWLGSPQGKDFVRQTSATWGEADIAGGEAPDKAKAAAERTRAAYSGEAEPPAEA